jgi:pimeloyl-ACP methyl ester carboxylesterase
LLYDNLEDGYVQTSLGRMHFKKTSMPGKKVIFLHGFGANTRAFKKIVEMLPSTIESYLVDLLGHGESEAPEISYTVENQTQALREFMKAKEAEESYLFGNSYGGWIAALIAQENFKGKGVILEDAVGLKEYFEEIAKNFTESEYKEKVMNEVRFLNPNKRVLDSILNAGKATSSFLTKESLANISKPTMVVWGENDATVDVKYASMFNDYIKGSRLELIKGAGHVPHYTHPERVRDLLLGFARS